MVRTIAPRDARGRFMSRLQRPTRWPEVHRFSDDGAEGRELQHAARARGKALANLNRTVAESLAAMAESVQQRGKLFSSGSYKAAATGVGARGDWNPSSMSPDDTMLHERDRAVARQRDLVRNSPWARALYEQLRSYVVGSQPWSSQPAARPEVLVRFGLSDTQVTEWNRRCDEVFEEAAAGDALDRERCCDLWELTRRAYGMRLDADGFARIWADAGSDALVSVELIEGDRVRTPHGKLNDPLVSFGVRRDKKTGEPWGFYVHDHYPHAMRRMTADDEFELVKRHTPAGQVQMLHLMRPERHPQTRGLPVLITVLGELDDLAAFAEAELMAARVSACIGLIIQSSNPLELDPQTGREKLRLKPGGHLRLGPNDVVTPFNPSRPNNSFEPFVNWRQRDVAASLGFSATLATRNFDNANYSVSRTILFDAKRTFEAEQRWLASTWFRPIYRRVIEAAWMDGRLPPLPLFDGANETALTNELLRVSFTAPPYGFVDPMTEVEAIGKALQYRLVDFKDVIGQLGKDDTLVHRALAEQMKRLRDAGIAPVGEEMPPAAEPPAPMGAPAAVAAPTEPVEVAP